MTPNLHVLAHDAAPTPISPHALPCTLGLAYGHLLGGGDSVRETTASARGAAGLREHGQRSRASKGLGPALLSAGRVCLSVLASPGHSGEAGTLTQVAPRKRRWRESFRGACSVRGRAGRTLMCEALDPNGGDVPEVWGHFQSNTLRSSWPPGSLGEAGLCCWLGCSPAATAAVKGLVSTSQSGEGKGTALGTRGPAACAQHC